MTEIEKANSWFKKMSERGCWCGIIYCYTNKINGKKYIGQTRRLPQIRHNEHHENYHKYGDSVAFHNAIVKYGGLNNFQYEVLEYISHKELQNTIDDLNESEVRLIKKHMSLVTQNGYNISVGGTGSAGCYGLTSSKIGVSMFDMDGNYIKSFGSIIEANKELGITGKSIKKAIDNKGKTSCGYLWARIGEEPYVPPKYTIFQYDLDGNFVKAFRNVFDAANYYNARNSTISNALKDDFRISYNSYWRRYYEEKIEVKYKDPVYQYDKEGKFLRMWPSKSIAYEVLFNRRSATLLSRAVNKKCLCANSYWSNEKVDHFEVPNKNMPSIVFQYDGITHELIAEYKSSIDASKSSGASVQNICNVMKGRHKLANGYIFSREKYDIYPFKEEACDTVFQYDGVTGKFVSGYKNMAEAAKLNGLANCVSIMNCLHGSGKMAAKSYWRYEKLDSVPVIKHRDSQLACKYDKNGNFIVRYENRREAALAEHGNKMYYKPISEAIKNESKMAFGGYWRAYQTDKINVL